MNLAGISFPNRGDGFDQGGVIHPGGDNISIEGGRDFQRGWESYEMPIAPGSNAYGPMMSQGRMNWVIQVAHFGAEGTNWHKYLCGNICFQLYDKSTVIDTKFEQRYDLPQAIPQRQFGDFNREPIAEAPVSGEVNWYEQDLENMIYNHGDLTHVLTLPYACYLLLKRFFKEGEIPVSQITSVLKPLGVMITQPKDLIVNQAETPEGLINNFNALDDQVATVKGAAAACNIYDDASGVCTQADDLYIMLVPVEYDPNESFIFNFDPDGGNVEYFDKSDRESYFKAAPSPIYGGPSTASVAKHRYYWDLRPYHGDTPPSVDLFTLELEDEWVTGHYWRVGKTWYEYWVGSKFSTNMLDGMVRNEPRNSHGGKSRFSRSMRNIMTQGKVRMFVDMLGYTPVLSI